MRRILPPANMSSAEIYIKTVLPRTLGAVSPRIMSPRGRGAGGKSSVGARLPKRADVYARRNTVFYVKIVKYVISCTWN